MNELELIFVVRLTHSKPLLETMTLEHQVAYQRILQLTYVEDLLAAIRTLFVKLFQPFLATFVASLHAASSSTASLKASGSGSETALTWDFARAFEKWDAIFDDLLKKFEAKSAQVRPLRCSLT